MNDSRARHAAAAPNFAGSHPAHRNARPVHPSPGDNSPTADHAREPATDRGAARYETLHDLIAALEASGVRCLGYEPILALRGAVARASCDMGAGNIVVSVYATSAETEEHVPTIAGVLSGVADVHMVVGPNWTVNCDSADQRERIAAATGGRQVHIPA
ncbi:MAG TPA: hypothetical protein VES42_07960 [Pilimelia sp.]|nr:hypothetical protein [Pilimelia sp.]